MFRKSIAAAVLVAGAAFVPAAAQAATGFTVEPTELRAGPDYDYPAIRTIRNDRRVEIYGCLNDWSFCDVGYRSDRGWVDASDIVVDYRSRRMGLVDAGPYVGIGFLSFSFGNYWDSYYRGRPFYHDRGRWERHYHDSWRSSWGPRRDRDWNDRHRDRNWNDRDRRGDRDWNDRDRDHRDGDRRDGRSRTDNDRRDGDRRDNDRRDNDNRTSYRGAPNNPAVTAPTPQPRPGLSERGDRRRDADRRDNDRSSNRDRTAPAATQTPRAAPSPQATTTPSRPAMDNDRPNRGTGAERSNRAVAERPDRPDTRAAGERRERPHEAPAQKREDREPRQKRAPTDPNPADEDNRPGR